MICDPRQSASATSSNKSVRCQSADPRITADLRPQADASAVRTSLVHGRLGEEGRRQVGAGPWLELVFSDSLGTDNILGLRQPGSNYKNTSYLSI